MDLKTYGGDNGNDLSTVINGSQNTSMNFKNQVDRNVFEKNILPLRSHETLLIIELTLLLLMLDMFLSFYRDLKDTKLSKIHTFLILSI